MGGCLSHKVAPVVILPKNVALYKRYDLPFLHEIAWGIAMYLKSDKSLLHHGPGYLLNDLFLPCRIANFKSQ